MADPILNEDYIIMLLKRPITIDSVASMQSAAVQTLLDIYDRKVTRDEFVELVAPCLALYGQTTKLWLLNNVKIAFEDHGVTMEELKRADDAIREIVAKQAKTCVETMERLKMCPTSKDVVH